VGGEKLAQILIVNNQQVGKGLDGARFESHPGLGCGQYWCSYLRDNGRQNHPQGFYLTYNLQQQRITLG
jgi:hypothetical protein